MEKNLFRVFTVLALTFLASGCGGGGGGSAPAFGTNDPLYGDQWNLKNTTQPGEDINVESVWSESCGATTCRGNGIRVVVVDDGLDYAHEDLSSNFTSTYSWNYVTGQLTPDHADPASGHGTLVAGVVAARDGNGVGGKGVAPRTTLAAYNLLENNDDVNSADAMTRNVAGVSISSNSWGAPDGTGTLMAPASTWYDAIDTGLSTGRNGLGTIYTWAAGNGAPTDNANQDALASYRGVIAVGAVMDDGTKSNYSERGANLWVSAPGGQFCEDSRTIVTTDRSGSAGVNNNGTNANYSLADITTDGNYTKCFNGTSSATPTVSGVVALMLQANPSLGWRDVRLILADTARQNDALNETDNIGWQIGELIPGSTTSRYHFHHNYGFGVVDAAAAVARARTWTNVGAELTPCTVSGNTNIAIPDNGSTITDAALLSGCAITKIEFVEVSFSSDHTYSSDLTIVLVSSAGMVSSLAETTACDTDLDGVSDICEPYSNWVFGSAAHLGENANGTWTLGIVDDALGDSGSITSWQITVYGRSN